MSTSTTPARSLPLGLTPLRLAAWVGAAVLLLVPLVAKQFTDQVQWTAGDFVFAAVLLFGSLGLVEVVLRRTDRRSYRLGVGLGVLATFTLVWGNGALQVTDSFADVYYSGCAALGVVGVVVALVRPRPGGFVLAGAALALVVSALVTLGAGYVPNDYVSTFELFALTGFFATLYAGAGWLLVTGAE